MFKIITLFTLLLFGLPLAFGAYSCQEAIFYINHNTTFSNQDRKMFFNEKQIRELSNLFAQYRTIKNINLKNNPNSLDIYLKTVDKYREWTKMIKKIQKKYEGYFRQWVRIDRNDIPWETLIERKQGLTQEEIVESFRYIYDHDLVCRDKTIMEDVNLMAELVLEIYFTHMFVLPE